MRVLAAIICLWAGAVSAQDVMVAGDSIMAWNRSSGAAIASVIADRTGLEVVDVSESGARLSAGLFAGRGDVRRQVGRARPGILIFDGGGNDLGSECGCGACDAVLDEMIDAGLEGQFRDFVEPLIEDGTKVIYLGYYDIPVGGNEFSPCVDEFETLEGRMIALAEATDGMEFVSGREVIDPSNLAHYDSDRLHPSKLGSERLGELLSEIVESLR